MNSKQKTNASKPTASNTEPSKSSGPRSYECLSIEIDGRLAWTVVAASFSINLIIDGFLYSFGAISEDLKNHYRCQEWAVSLIISLACGFYMLAAPVASALSARIGYGLVSIIGSVIASVSIAASVFSPNIYVMWLLFGFFGGVGMDLIYLPSIVIVGHCFHRKRAIATGIVTAGTGIGSIIFGPLSSFLFNELGWQTGLQTLAAIIMICAFCSLLIVAVKPVPSSKKPKAPTQSNNDEKLPEKVNNDVSSTVSKANGTISALPFSSESKENSLLPSKADEGETDFSINHEKRFSSVPPLAHQSSDDTPTTMLPALGEYAAISGSCKSLRSLTTLNAPHRRKNLTLIYLANICSMIGYFTPYLFVVKTAQLERSIPREQAVYLLSIIGVSNTIGRFASGWIAMLPGLNSIRANNIGLALAGVSTLLVPLCRTHMHFVIYCIVWGASIALHISLSSVIVCEIVGVKSFGRVLGLTLMFRGFTSLAAPPVMGAIRDITSSFTIAFIIGGVSFLVSALLYCFLTVERGSPTTKQKPPSTGEEKSPLNA